MPAGLSQLYDLGQRFGSSGGVFPEDFRAVVSVPTQRLAAVALALGALSNVWDCDRLCRHRVVNNLHGRAAFYDDKHLQDGNVYLETERKIRVGAQNSFGRNRGIHLLPENFPQRDRMPRGRDFEEELADLVAALDCEPSQAGIERSELGVHPVIVVGHDSSLLRDVRLDASPLSFLHPRGRLAPGRLVNEDTPGWFRHPVLLTGKLPNPGGGFEWLQQVLPRLVVYTSLNAVQRSFRYLWPKTPQVVLLSRRSRASAKVLQPVEDLAWRDASIQPSPAVEALQPGNGLEIRCWIEPSQIAPPETDEDGPEW